jgi:hypothetical protein
VLYEFERVGGGEYATFDFPIGRAPKIGATIRRNGRRYVRIPSSPQVPSTNYHTKYSFMSRSLPKDPGNKRGMYPRVDKQGRPLFASKREVSEVVARSEGGLIYDAGTEHIDS